MNFVDLDRHFVPLANDKDAMIDWGPHWGRKYGGWLSWPDLLTRRRVALLAEALSGKTKELEYRTTLMKKQGHPAFFVRIEDLVDRGFEAALDETDVELFKAWKAASSGDAWFFLDSVDEARLNGKRFSNALQTFRRELGRANLNRSFVIVSCRASDWKGKSDREALQNELPFDDVEEISFPQGDPDEILLAPIFNTEKKQTSKSREEPKIRPSELQVVQLAPLSSEQKLQMAVAAGLDGKVFLNAINLSGLDAMAERPGDLIDLIDYWVEKKEFGSLLDMTEEGVRRKLREEDAYRSDASVLSPEKARQGAERIAAALVLGKTFSIKAPGQEPDPMLSQGAIDPSTVLSDWDQTAVNALLRTGLFAPSTYGRVKFHQRTTQEYLAACWIRSLLLNNCPMTEIHELLFVEPYGVKTAVPTLITVAAWLSQWIPSVRDELIKREPASLIAHGDPKSLSLKVREALLDSYARLDAAGLLGAESIDYRAAWMFSDPALAAAVRRSWNANSRSNFRLQLLQFIEEGRIKGCVNLAKQAALDLSQDQYIRLLAARALVACEGYAGLKALAKQVRAEPDRLSARLAPQLAELLYPHYLNTADLLQLIDRAQPAASFSTEGFASHLATLHKQAPSRDAQRQLVDGVATFVFAPAHMDEPDETSNRHAELCNGILELASAELAQCVPGEVSDGMLRLLMAVERTYRTYGDADMLQSLASRVQRDKSLNRQLMWADATTSRTGSPKLTLPVHVGQIGPHTGRTLWKTDLTDLEWLATDARNMPNEHERRVAFSAALVALNGANQMMSPHALLDELASHDLALRTDLAEYTAPQIPEEWEVSQLEHQRKEQEERDVTRQSWIDFRNTLKAQPGVLDNAEALASWTAGLHRLYHLTSWLKLKATQEGKKAMASWPLLGTAFGPEVAEHYANAMRLAWRRITPERPKVTRDNSYTTKCISILAVDALELESLDPKWPVGLSDSDAQLAIRHATMAGSIEAEWAARLIDTKRAAVLAELVSAVRLEFKSGGRFSDTLVQAAYHETAARSEITTEVFRLLKAKEPVDKGTLQYCLRIVKRGLNVLLGKDVLTLVKKRLATHLAARDDDRTFEYLGVLASLDGEGVARLVLAQLVRDITESDADFVARVQRWLGALFSSHITNGVATPALQTMLVTSLAQFLRLAYRHIPPRGDRQPRPDSRVSARDAAEGARNSLLQALLTRPGADAYAVITLLANEPDFVDSALRFKELAHGKAQGDADLVPWSATEVVSFGREHSAPVKTGMQLLRLMVGVLGDISGSFENTDASSRAVLARAEDEEEVQHWLAERLNERRRGRYHVHREAEVANRNEPDIIVSSVSTDVQVAIEVKNANMGWTVTQLESAILNQLGHDYLRTENRRHGILVVSLHRPKTWRVAGQVWDFDRLIAHLQAFAAETKSNRTGTIEVRAIGINACPPRLRTTAKEPKASSKSTATKKSATSTLGSEKFQASALPALDASGELF